MSFTAYWQSELSDYITAIAWFPDGQSFVVSTAAGEVARCGLASPTWVVLQHPTGRSVDGLAVSADGQFVAAGGQDGAVRIWRGTPPSNEEVTTLNHRSVWVDRLLWHPTLNQLAFGLGRYAQVWDAGTETVITTLNFESSAVLGMDWHPSGQLIALCGHRGARVWNATDWDEDPQVLELPSASVAIAWSPDGLYLAEGNLDNTLTVVEWARSQNPWVMQGFPGKVRHLAWSQRPTASGAPLLASCSAESIITWERSPDPGVGWANQVLNVHEGLVQAIAFQPQAFLLASAASDGCVCLWQDALELVQVLEGAENGLSCLSWHPQGTFLATGGQAGEISLWQDNPAWQLLPQPKGLNPMPLIQVSRDRHAI